MRLRELVRRVGRDIEHVVDTSPGLLDLEAYLGLPDGVSYERSRVPTDAEAGTLVVALIGPDPRRHDEVDRLADITAGLHEGARLLVLLGWPGRELPVNRVLGPLGDAAVRVKGAVFLEYEHLKGAVFGEALADLSNDDRALDYALLVDFSARAVEGRLREAERRIDELIRSRRPDGKESSQSRVAELESRLAAAENRLADSEKTRRRLWAVEHSTAYRVSRVLANGLAKPGRETAKVPRKLRTIWKERRQAPGAPASLAPRAPSVVEHVDRRFVAFKPAASEPINGVARLAIAGAVTASSARRLGEACSFTSLVPHDALLMLERAQPDIVLIETAASTAGSAWATAGTATGARRDEQLLTLVEAARRIDVPTVLWRNSPASSAPLAERFQRVVDLVVSDRGLEGGGDAFNLGIGLDRAVPPIARDRRAGFHGALDPRLGPDLLSWLERLLGAASRYGLSCWDDGSTVDLVHPGVRRAPGEWNGYLADDGGWARYRGLGVLVCAPAVGPEGLLQGSRRVLEQVLAGSAVVVHDRASVPASFATRVVAAADGDPEEALNEAAGLDDLDTASLVAMRRELDRDWTPRSQLRRLAAACGVKLGVDASLALLVARSDAEAVLGLADRAGGNLFDTIVVGGPLPAGLASRLDGMNRGGIDVAVIDTGEGPDSLARLVQGAGTRWVTLADSRAEVSSLHPMRDLTRAAESWRADAAVVADFESERLVHEAPVGGSVVASEAVTAGRLTVSSNDDNIVWDGAAAIVGVPENALSRAVLP